VLQYTIVKYLLELEWLGQCYKPSDPELDLPIG
jgi:hypothetical protein